MDAVGLLAGGIAHDFNNLLMVISAYAEMGLQTLYSDHPLRRNLQEILAASHRASDLTKQLLASGRKQTPEPQRVSLNSAIEQTCQLLPRVVGEDVELRLSLGNNLGNIRIDLGQIERVVLNLAVNARDAMPNGGVLGISTQSVLPGRSFVAKNPNVSEEEYVLLAVTDTGQGIAAEEIPKIFQPFYTTKPEGKGTGLGLAMVERIVSRDGGFIGVESQLGAGTTFRVYFPVVGRARETRDNSSPVPDPVRQGWKRYSLLKTKTRFES